MMDEHLIALGALLSANDSIYSSYKRLQILNECTVEGSRYKTFTGLSMKEVKEAYELASEAIRKLEKAVSRMQRYEDER